MARDLEWEPFRIEDIGSAEAMRQEFAWLIQETARSQCSFRRISKGEKQEVGSERRGWGKRRDHVGLHYPCKVRTWILLRKLLVGFEQEGPDLTYVLTSYSGGCIDSGLKEMSLRGTLRTAKGIGKNRSTSAILSSSRCDPNGCFSEYSAWEASFHSI